jgi:hypothetical protein
MRDHLISILRNARTIKIEAASVCVQDLAESIEVEVMGALQGGKYLIPSKLFGEITIPHDVITAMSNGDDDIWFSYSMQLDVNVFYADGWQFNIYPVKHGQINTDTELEHGKL